MCVAAAGVFVVTLLFLTPLSLAYGEGGELAALSASRRNPAAASVEARLELLEDQQIEIYHSLAKNKASGLASPFTDRLTLSGLIEMEGWAANTTFADGSSEAASDLVLATAQFTFELALLEGATVDVSFLFDEDAAGLKVDEATINLASDPWVGRLGRQYLPFGVFPSHFISDPLTLELGETRGTAVLVGYKSELATLSVYAFKGNTARAGEGDHIRDWGASLALTPLKGLEVGGSYLTELAAANGGLVTECRHRVGGWSAFMHLNLGPVSLSGEILGAVRPFAASDLDADRDGAGDQPLAWNVESAFRPFDEIELALRCEGSAEFAGRPRRQYGVDVSWKKWEQITVSLEYLCGEFDRDFAGNLVNGEASPGDRRYLFTARLAFEF